MSKSQFEIKRMIIDSKKIFVIDNVLGKEELKILFKEIQKGHWQRGQHNSKETSKNKFWTYYWEPNSAVCNFLFDRMRPFLKSCFKSNKSYQVHMSYANSNFYGDSLYPHKDSDIVGRVSGLYYLNPEWKLNWGGETIFYNSKNQAEFCVSPSPGKLVLFESDILHRGSVPDKSCHVERIIANFKIY